MPLEHNPTRENTLTNTVRGYMFAKKNTLSELALAMISEVLEFGGTFAWNTNHL